MRRTLISPPVSLPDHLPRYVPERLPELVIPAHDAANTSFIRSAIQAMRRLDRARRIILIGLAALATLITVATTVYAFLPEPVAAPAVFATPPATRSLGGSSAAPSLSGGYALIGAPGSQEWLSLQQFGDHITGTLTIFACQSGASLIEHAIVTGALLSDGQLRLTVTLPTMPHSQTTVYALALTATGFDLTWSGSAGHAQMQQWAQATVPQSFAGCTAPRP